MADLAPAPRRTFALVPVIGLAAAALAIGAGVSGLATSAAPAVVPAPIEDATPARVAHGDGTWLRADALGFEVRDPGPAYRPLPGVVDRLGLADDPSLAAWAWTTDAGADRTLVILAMRPGPRGADAFGALVDGLGRSFARLAAPRAAPVGAPRRALDWDAGRASLGLTLVDARGVEARALLLRPSDDHPTFVIAASLGASPEALRDVVESLRPTATATATAAAR